MSTSDGSDPRDAALLGRRQELTDALVSSPYDLVLYLARALVHSDLGYPDLAAGDAYRALLLTDEVRNEGFEYHEQASEALRQYPTNPPPEVLQHGTLPTSRSTFMNGGDNIATHNADAHDDLAVLASVRCYQMLSLSLLLCGCLKSSYQFCERGLASIPKNKELLETKSYIETVAKARLRISPDSQLNVNSLPEWGLVRREVYPWNDYEPDRFSDEALANLNAQITKVAPKVAVRISQLPVLLDGASDTDGYEIIPTCNQLGLFAKEDIAPREVVLREYSLLTANNRLKESTCDACGSELPPLGPASSAVSCPDCHDTVFCDDFCFQQAQQLYHPAVCDKDVDAIAKEPDAAEADEALYLLLLARVLAMAAHQRIHPLDVAEVKYVWGDFVPTGTNAIDLSPNAGPPPEWTLPFSFRHNVETPLHVLERMDVDVFATLARHDVWVLNTLYSKFRGTASARKSPRDGRPEVAAVHPLWCLANHNCDPNVQWEWGGRMVLWARETSVRGRRPAGIRAGDEVLNHYCDVSLPVWQRREWARGSLGGWCMCQRCRDESAAKQPNGVVVNGVANGVEH